MIDEDEDDLPPPRPISAAAVAGVAITFVGNLGRSMSAFADDVATMIGQHVQYTWDRGAAWERMHRDLESLPVTE